jgi:hypothetical protein
MTGINLGQMVNYRIGIQNNQLCDAKKLTILNCFYLCTITYTSVKSSQTNS